MSTVRQTQILATVLLLCGACIISLTITQQIDRGLIDEALAMTAGTAAVILAFVAFALIGGLTAPHPRPETQKAPPPPAQPRGE